MNLLKFLVFFIIVPAAIYIIGWSAVFAYKLAMFLEMSSTYAKWAIGIAMVFGLLNIISGVFRD